MDVFGDIRNDSRVVELARLLKAGNTPVAAEGLWGSSAPILAGLIAERLERPLLLVAAHSDEADDIRDDIETTLGRAPELLPALETLPQEGAPDELAGERLRLCLALLTWQQQRGRDAAGSRGPADPLGPPLIVAPLMALMQPVPTAGAIQARSLDLETGRRVDPDEVTAWLTAHGFQRCDAVEVPGDFARRGGIIDIFSAGQAEPVRVEYFDDVIESIRVFEAGTQRSSHALGAVRIPAFAFSGHDRAMVSETTSFLSHLPADAIVALLEPTEIQEIGRTFMQRIGERVGVITPEGLLRRANDFTQLHLQRFTGVGEECVRFEVGSLPQFEPKSTDALAALAELTADHAVIVLCDNRPEEQRFAELLANPPDEETAADADDDEESGEKPPALVKTPPADPGVRARQLQHVQTAVGVLHRGFVWNKTAYIPHHELFRRYRQRRTLRRVQPARPVDEFFDLQAGDYVVHVTHGIGRFLGLKSLEKDGQTSEYLAIEFADKATVHVPISQIHVVQKYIGSFRGRPKLSKLGGTAWKKTKERVAEAVTDLAAELLAVQARRAAEAGISYPHDTQWQREFEGSFLYEETPDQLRALEEIKRDMTRPRPMDRLLCGDVGFGKTELALRAAFKVIEYGRQVAVLVPTTVLAEQHFRTFRERLADYPFVVEGLSRFRTKQDQARIVERTRKGQVDIVVGTHRLLSKDVRFADLGLVVIDEEQRFGVEAKERLKQMRATVEVLTMTATPIPRTLHMSMLGIRDISALTTPPVDRRAIVTQVRMWDDRMIREAIMRELNRDGQAYFVHNFVRDIHAIANRLRTLVPEARFVVAHGQMPGAELEEVMLKFLQREADVLVSTNIIESGLDIPSANTIFVNRAERFGLADLHQLRGRVGRSKHRAYAYALLSPKHKVNDIAARRLKAFEHYSDLGSGFQIAMRDLEIRGAGNILGPEQSGHIEAVGYDMYCQLLEQAVRRLRHEPAELHRPVNLDLGITASIPRGYIRADRQRMEVYKRLTNCHTVAELAVLRDDLRDAFGPLPRIVETLLQMAEIRVLAQPWGIRALVVDGPDVVFSIDDLQKVQPLLAEGPGSPRVPDPHTIHWRLPKRLLDPEMLLDVLRRQLADTPGPTAAVPAGR